MLRTEALSFSNGAAPGVVKWWRDAASASSSPPSGADATSSPEWSLAVARAFQPMNVKLLVAYDGDDTQVAAVLPVCRHPQNASRAFGCGISLLTQFYCGRVGLLARRAHAGAARALVNRLDQEYADWSYLQFTAANDDADTKMFIDGLKDVTSAIELEPLPESPYIVLPERFDDYFCTLKPGFRTEIRRGERRLREKGALTRRLFTSAAQVRDLWEAVCHIERNSWKEAAGTSITTNPQQMSFYQEYLPVGAEAGQLLAAVLYLDGQPIAHKLCLRSEGTVAVLKMSFVDDLKRFYPSTVLLAGYLSDIIEQGVHHLDFMGVCDDFKMRWTNLTYGRTEYRIYRNSLTGHLSYGRKRASKWLDSLRKGGSRPMGSAAALVAR